MANNWVESRPNLVAHEFEIYDNVSTSMYMEHFHGHSFYEIRFIIYGHILHYTETSVIELCDGAVSVVPPGLFHRAMPAASADDPYARVLLYVSTEFMHALDSDALNLSGVFDRFGYHGKQHLHLPGETMRALFEPLQEIVASDNDDKPLRHLINRSSVVLSLARLAELLEQSVDPYQSTGEISLVPRVIAHINANLSENLSLDSLAERFFVSKFYLSHQFKQYTQLSLHQYILARRMMHAQILLRSGYSPTVVARECGYHEYSSFYKAFLRETGKSPRRFT